MKRLFSNDIPFLPVRAKAIVFLLFLFELLGLSPIAMAEDPVYFADETVEKPLFKERLLSC